MKKKGIELTMNTIIIAALLLILLTVMFFLIMKYIQGPGNDVIRTVMCENRGGKCVPKEDSCADGVKLVGLGCPTTKGGPDIYCCTSK